MRELIAVYNGMRLPVIPDAQNEWILKTEFVADAYGIASNSLRSTRKRHTAELIEGKHFITVANCNGNPRAGYSHVNTFWTKRGVIRLGFFIRGPRAKRFRDWAEDLVLDKLENNTQHVQPEPQYVEQDEPQYVEQDRSANPSPIDLLEAFVKTFRDMENRLTELEFNMKATLGRTSGLERQAFQVLPSQINTNQPVIKKPELPQANYHTVRQYANANRYRMSPELALEIGMQCGRVSRVNGVPVFRIEHARNSYRIDILENVFFAFQDRLSKYIHTSTLSK